MTNTQLVSLAAILHDIGKFMQLAGFKLSTEQENVYKKFNLSTRNNSSFYHALLGAQFIKMNFPEVDEKLWALVAFHHEPHKAPDEIKLFAKIIAIADSIIHGEYRSQEVDIEEKIFKRPLVSIFSKITLQDRLRENKYIRPSVLGLDLKNLFPLPEQKQAIPPNKNVFEGLWNAFTNEFKKINYDAGYDIYFHQLLFLLEKYTITIPAFTEKGETCIPLYQHLKLVSAMSHCISTIAPDQIEMIFHSILNQESNTPILQNPISYLIGGDTSGIQDFIYSVTSEKALKGLRGRSFYLQLLSDSIAKSILASFELTLANIFFIGGGHFYLLLPPTAEIKKQLELIKEQINDNLFQAHRGKLAVAISEIQLTPVDFLGNHFQSIYNQLKHKLSINKRKKFVSLFNSEKDIAKLLGPFDIGGVQRVCEICSNELLENETGNKHCNFCQSFIELANHLAKVTTFSEKKMPTLFKKLDHNPQSYADVIQHFGFNYNLIDHENSDRTYLINSTEFLKNTTYSGFQFFPQCAPMSSSFSIKTLEEFAKDSNGLSTWGVARADVDHLGNIFKKGLGEKSSILEISTLSYFVSLFFSAHVEKIGRDDFSKAIYIIYSGGDDMFALGPWSKLPEFVRTINSEFRKFTGNQEITLSSGIFISPSKKYPVYQAADSAGDNLEKAKNAGRNHVTMLDKPVTWTEFEEVNELQTLITDLIQTQEGDAVTESQDKKIPHSLLQILYSAWAEHKKAEDENQEKAKLDTSERLSMFRVWRLLYAFKRLKERHKKHSQELTQLEMKILHDHKLMPNLDISIRWAELLTRKKGETVNGESRNR